MTISLAVFIENLQERNLPSQELLGLTAEMKGSGESRNLEAPGVRKSDCFCILHSKREKTEKDFGQKRPVMLSQVNRGMRLSMSTSHETHFTWPRKGPQ